MKKRILIFSTAYFPLVGGAEVAVKEITDRLPDFEFVMLTARLKPALPSVEQIGNITVYRLGKGNHLDKFRLIWSGCQEAKKLGARDAVWSIMASYAGFAALRYKKINPRVPFLLTLQEGDSKWQIYKHVWWCWWYFKKIFTKADRIQALSNYLAAWAKGLGAKSLIEVVPNGVDVKNFQFPTLPTGRQVSNFQLNPNDQTSNLKQRLGLSPDAKIVITISRLVKKNGIGDLIRSVRYLPSNVHLLVAGDGELKAALKEEAERLGVRDRVHWLGSISHADLPKYLAASDVFCRPSLSEGLGNAFLEAMAAGVPVVATNVGGIPDFLLDGETGLFCKVRDPHDIARQIKRILDDPALADKLRINGQKLVPEKYSWDGIAISMRKIFDSLRIPMRLLIAADIFPPESGGPATYAVTLANELVKQGIEVKIVSLNKNSDRRVLNEKVKLWHVHFSKGNKLFRYFEYWLLLWLSAWTADVIYAMGPVNAGYPAFLAHQWCPWKKWKRKFIVKVVGDYAWEQWQQGDANYVPVEEFQTKQISGKIDELKETERKVVRKADAVIVPSDYLAMIVQGWGVAKNKVYIIGNVVEISDASPINKSAGEKWIISVGRLVRWKGMDTLIELMPIIIKQIPAARLKIVGDGPEYQKLKMKVESLNLTGAVELTRNLPKDKTLSYIKAADVFVLNSGYEGLSHAALEALYLGLGSKMILSNVGGNSEVIPNKENLFSYNAKEDITWRIISILNKNIPTGPFISPHQNMLEKTKMLLRVFVSICAN